MRWRQSKESQNIKDYRGRSTGGGFGGGGLKIGGIGTLIALVAAWYFGVDPRVVMGLLGGGDSVPQAEAPIEAGAPGDESGQFVAHVLGDTEETWSAIFSAAGREYPAPMLSLFSKGINTACGSATSAAGPFYCPADNNVYIDLAFFRQLETEFAAQGDFAKAYVIAHEVGHHVQTVLGTSDKIRAAQQQARSQEEANQLQVRMELQADCFAGIWAYHADSARKLVEDGDIDEALGAAQAVGDDTIQRRVQGNVHQETFTHGSGAQRQEWFRKGYASGQVDSCNTFR
jgi:predicted metalloprotease